MKMKLPKHLVDSKGFTLIEVLAAGVLLIFIIGLMYSFLLFGLNASDRGQKQSDLQDELRIGSRLIADSLKYASQVELVDANACPGPTAMAVEFNYLCVNSLNQEIMDYRYNSATFSRTAVQLLAKQPGSKGSYELVFRKADDFHLSYSILATEDGQSFTTESTINLLNLKLAHQVITEPPTSASVYRTIRYKTAAP